MDATWIPPEAPPPARSALPVSAFAFPVQRKEPLTDARHVRSAIARFRQVAHVSDADRAQAISNIQKTAQYYSVHLTVTSWVDLGSPK